MTEATISVIIPCYNCIKTINKCVLSLLASKDVTLQIILADDGSTDGTSEVCKQFASSYPQISYISLPHKGVSAARNAGLRAATGDYIGFTDSDDYVEPDMFSSLLNKISSEEILISVCGYYLEFPDFRSEYCYKETTSINHRDFLLNLFSDSKTEGFLFNKLFSAKLLNGHFFDETLSVCEDLDFIFRLAASENAKVIYCPKSLYHYVQNDSSLTGGRNHFKNNIFRYAPAFYKLREITKDREILKVLGKKYYIIIRNTMSVIMTINTSHPTRTSEDYNELKLLRKELRRSYKKGVFSSFSLREKLSFLKHSICPIPILIKLHDRKHG